MLCPAAAQLLWHPGLLHSEACASWYQIAEMFSISHSDAIVPWHWAVQEQLTGVAAQQQAYKSTRAHLSSRAGAAQMTCCPFWYWMRLRCCSVDRTSSTLMPVVSLNSLMEMVVVWDRRTCRCSSSASEVA